MAEKRLGIVVDTKRCIACNSCAVACKIDNNLPNGVWWNKVLNVGGSNLDSPEERIQILRCPASLFLVNIAKTRHV